MIEKMEKVYVYSLRDQSSDIMDAIMRRGVVELSLAETMLDEKAAKELTRDEGTDLSKEEELLYKLEECIDVLKEFGEKRSIFYKKPEMTYEALTHDGMVAAAIKSCFEVEAIINERAKLQKILQKLEMRAAALTPWQSLNIKSDDFMTRHAKVLLYVMPNIRSVEDIEKDFEERKLSAYAHEVSCDAENRYIVLIFYKKDEKAVRTAVSTMGMKEFIPESFEGTFKSAISLCENQMKDIKQQIEKENEKLQQVSDRRIEFETAYDAVKIRIDCLSGRNKLVHTDKVDVITGWVVADQKEKISNELERFSCCYEYAEPEKNEDFPVLMKNSKLVEPFGALTEMYSLPNSNSMDTNWAIGLFFFIFFGMMLSDAGYGLLLTVGGLLGAKLLNVGEGMKRLMTMMGLAGISTMLWGLIYGSFFGDAIPKVAEVFLGKTVEIPQLIDPLSQPMVVLVLSCALGVIHLFLGMGFKAYLMIKRGDKWGALFDVGFWYVFLIGLPCLALPGGLKMIGIVMSIAGAAGLVLTQGRKKPTVFGKITGGVMSLYDVTGYFSDVLSYSRILALGLATGVIASVVNTIGSLMGGGIIGFILFVVIFVFGHALNMAINALGAYVHSARLQYVEFFGKYYESGGRKFNPLKAKTKYVNVTEEK